MNTLDFGVQEPYKSYILSGEKTIEGRLNKGKFKAINIGDILEFDTGEKFELINKYLYPTFEEMLAREGLKHVLPDKKTIKDWVENVYYTFYSPEKEKEFGIVALEIKKI